MNEGPDWRRTAPVGMVAGVLASLPRAALSIIAALIGVRNIGDPAIVVLVLVAVSGIALGWVVLGWRHHRYLIGPDDLRIEQGILSRQVRAIPYDRIHDVALREPLAARLFGLVEVAFDTGTGGKDEAKLAFVTRAEGAALRDTVRARRSGVAADAPVIAEVTPAVSETRTLFALTPGRLLLFGLFEFSLVVFAVLAGAAQQFDFLLPDLDWREWRELGGQPLQWLLGLGLAVQVIAAVLGLLLLIPIGLLTGVVRTALRDWGFRLEETSRGLRRRRGLLTRSDVVMPLERVQALVLGTGLPRRRWGWHSLRAISLAQDSKDQSHVLVPFAQAAEIAPVAALTGLPLPGDGVDWRRASARWRSDRMVLAALLPLLAGAGLLLLPLDLPAGTALVPAVILWLLAAVLAFRQYYLWRHNRHALTGDLLCSREGWLSPHLVVATPVKLQSVELRQGPLARLGDYADLHLGLAGGTLALHGLPLPEAQAMRAAMVARMAAVDFTAANLART
ncbi:hypothetical protein PK98_11485 [Croceibacterium mercuriale]|uniref:YdbS-like PH domain-containing protein n=1 Tax=Croceibacterium mercuriale TaxID=1572751 RepID=A0A0B2BSP7_9SPHN|nr:PH domain-containing protein [Croceibacterium mercuriale]KHL24593.1 hypothetical protein PK98_11485 [Croceibacterium mercuriale]